MSVRRLAAASLVAGVLLAGCSDDAEPRFEEPSSSPSPGESGTSEAGQAQTPEEFIREWVELHTGMQNTGRTREFRDRSRTCGPCLTFADRVEDIYANGGRIETTGWELDDIDCDEGKAPVTCEAKVTSGATRFKETSEAATQELPGGALLEGFTLRRRAGSWTMTDTYEIAQ